MNTGAPRTIQGRAFQFLLIVSTLALSWLGKGRGRVKPRAAIATSACLLVLIVLELLTYAG